jgi:protein translocase SecG subunit|tara:strand:+ start:250 stop:663 length:414 start_codon:yes stop_codon:yes gene_type:complete
MIVFLTTLLILVCFVVVLLIMIQRTSGGMGSALGGGTADQVLGAGSAAQLTKMTVWGILGFFVLSFALYAFYQSEAGSSEELQRLGTGTPVLQPNPTDPLPGSAPVSTLSPVEVPVTSPVENAPVVSDPVSETNSSK